MSSKRFLVAIEKVQYLSLTVIRVCPIRFYMERLLISSKSLFKAVKTMENISFPIVSRGELVIKVNGLFVGGKGFPVMIGSIVDISFI